MLRTRIALAVALAAPALASAQGAGPSAATAAAPAALAQLKADYFAELGDVQLKVKQLAEAIPEAKYGWRPAEGVRSVAEVFLHIAGGNYFLTKMAGVPIPADVPAELEKLSAKKDVLAWLDKSFAHVRAELERATPEQMAREVDFFGQKTTVRGLYLKAYGHVSEHLGQAVAYARSNGIVPPWSK
jgi:uncharacterized damage-inducible protein DinB